MRTPLLAPILLGIMLCAAAPGVVGQTPPDGPPSLSTYIEQLKSPDQKARLRAASAIAAMGPRAKDAVPQLTAMLDGTPPVEQIAAAMALAKIGPDAKPAVPALQRMAAHGDENARKVAELSIEVIDPPFLTVLMERLGSPYVLASLISVGAGAIVLVVLGLRRSSKIPEPVWKEEQAKAQQARAQKAKEREKEKEAAAAKVAKADTVAAAPPKPAPAAPPVASSAAPKSAPTASSATADRVPKHRARVSRPLLGLENYVTEQEGPESIKRDLTRAQEDLRKISDTQKELSGFLEKDDVKRDPERMRNLRKDIDEFAIEHYRAEVRVKALEIKLIQALVGDGKTSDAELRERTAATLKQKWDELRTLCETPSKIAYKSGQWVTTATGPTAPIADLRARLRDFDVVLPEGAAEPSPEPAAEQSAEPSGEPNTEESAPA